MVCFLFFCVLFKKILGGSAFGFFRFLWLYIFFGVLENYIFFYFVGISFWRRFTARLSESVFLGSWRSWRRTCIWRVRTRRVSWIDTLFSRWYGVSGFFGRRGFWGGLLVLCSYSLMVYSLVCFFWYILIRFCFLGIGGG